MFFSRISIKRLGILLHPGIEFGIGRLILLDVIFYRLLFESEHDTSHDIKPSPGARVAERELALLLEGHFQPEPRKMKNTEWHATTGADHQNVGVGHNMT